MIKKLLLTILLAVMEIICFAQQKKIAFEKYGVTEGLPEEVVIDPLQDDKGFIWFGTQNGLVKYDGYRFKVFNATSDKADTTNLQFSHFGGGLLKAKDGKIWIGAGYGKSILSSFDPLTEKFKTFYAEGKTTIADNDKIVQLLFEDEAENIWFKNYSDLTRKWVGTYCLNPTSGEIKKYPLADRFFRIDRGFGTLESSGTVWLLDEKNNLQRLNRQKDRFEIITPAGKGILPSGKADTIRLISKVSANRLLLTSTHSLNIFDPKTQKIVKNYVHQPNNANAIADSIEYAIEDLKGQIWLTHRQGKISLIDPVSNKIQTFVYGTPPLPYQKGITKIQNFFVTAQNKEGILFQAWAGQGKSSFFIHFQFATNTFSLYDYNFNLPTNPLPQNPSRYKSLQDRTGLLWLNIRPGLYKQTPKKQRMDLFRFRADAPNGLPADSIRYLFEDSKKRLWVGTANGLALYQASQGNFKVFKNNPSNPTSISNNAITALQEDADGKIWVGTRNGLNLYQESTGSFKRFFYSPKEINNCAFIFPDKQQRLWVSIWDKGVFVLDKNTGRIIKSFVPDAKNPASLTGNRIEVFYQDSRGNIWLGDRDDNQFGLYRLNPKEDGFTHYLPVSGDSTSISSDRIRFIAEDGKKRLWIGTNGAGLNLYHHDKNNFTVFRNSKLASISYFTTDKRGEPWFATYGGGGLVSVDAENGTITAYDESKGLLHNDLSVGQNGRIVKDEFGRFWLPTQRGLSVFDPGKKSFASYFEKDGFQPYDRRYVGIKSSNGDIWIGGSNGLNRIVPANLLKKDTTLPAIVITQVTINDSLYSKPDGAIFKQSVAYTNAIELKHWQKNLSFDFVALHYLSSEDNLYSWKLENYDKNWSAPSKERKAAYTNLSPGTYIFRVKASNSDGVWNEEGMAMTITILPPWWLTWWAYTIYALLFLAALRTFSLWRERNLRQEKEQLQHKVEERTIELKTKSTQLEHSLTELKSTQAQLIQSEKLASLGELTAGIAHEIQNPLNFVNNFSELSVELIEELKSPLTPEGGIREGEKVDMELLEDVVVNLEKINLHGKRASSIVSGMLEHSKASTGDRALTDINKLADEYLRLSYHGIRAKDNTFNSDYQTDFDENLPQIEVIPQDMGRVLLNLINNAFWAVKTVEKPLVVVKTEHTDNQLIIKVSDNGTGMTDEVKAKIFQPFFTTKPTGQGTGLGLSLAYDIVTKGHGGTLEVQSKEGEGSTFIIQLPISIA